MPLKRFTLTKKLLFGVSAAFLIGILFSVSKSFFLEEDKVTSDINTEIDRIDEMFDERGVEETYDFFKNSYKDKDKYKIAHDLGHFVGKELYEREGEGGVLYCDEVYEWGCYHGFFGRAISAEGLSFIEKIDEACESEDQSKFRGCLHGAGHGLLVLRGYEYGGLTSALGDCDKLNIKVGQDSCYTGVFMEFNLHTMENPPQSTVNQRPFREDNPLYPCDEVQESYKTTCYSELPSWWIMTGMSFSEVPRYCSMAGNYHETCLVGMGRATPILGYNKENMRDACLEAGTGYEGYTCLTEAMRQMAHFEGEAPISYCDILDNQFRELCRRDF